MATQNQPVKASGQHPATSSLLMGTGLAFASLILVPALAVSIGMGPSLTGALRMALMKASNRAIAKGGSSLTASDRQATRH